MNIARTAPLLLLLGACGSGETLIGPATTYAHRVAYVADGQQDEVFRVYVAGYDGGVRDLTGTLVAGGNVSQYAWSPDELRVAFVADAFFDGLRQLFVSDATGAARIDVGGALTPFGNMGTFKWAPNGARLAFLAESDTVGVFELLSVRPDGSGRVKLNGALVLGQNVTNMYWSPDSTRVAYVANQVDPAALELYVAPADGSAAAVRVSGPTVAGGNIAFQPGSVAWAPNGARIAYRADQDTNDLFELYVAQADGSGNFEVSGLVSQSIPRFAWSPNGARLAYLGVQDDPTKQELYSVLPTGLGNVRVSDDLVTGGNVEVFEWSPDSTRLAYRADQELDTQQSLYVAPAAGGTVVELSGTVNDLGVEQFAWAPDGSRLAYLARQDSFLYMELYTVLPNGTQNLRVSADFTVAGSVSNLMWSPSSSRLAYMADLGVPGVQELHATGAQGGSVQVSGPSQTGQSVQTYDWSADGASLIYVAPSVNFDQSELFVNSPGGSARRLSAAMQGGGDVLDFQAPGRD